MLSSVGSVSRPVAIVALGVFFLGCNEAAQSEAAPPSATPVAPTQVGFQVPPPAPGAGTGVTALEWTVPAGWVAEPPGTSFRKAQYRVPAASGDALFIVFYFGPQQGGSSQANIERWADQFAQPDGRSGSQVMKSATKTVGGIEIQTVEVTGTYSGGFMTQGPPQADQMLLGAVAKGPDANWFFKFTGPRGTVEAQRAAFDGLLGSLRVGS